MPSLHIIIGPLGSDVSSEAKDWLGKPLMSIVNNI
jgi:hypothetical protein